MKIGDKYKVIQRNSGHGFAIGTIVEIISKDGRCKSGKQEWYLTKLELKKIRRLTKEPNKA